MGKRLPYYQFEPSQWLAGDICFCSMAAQGMFINITALYWQRECVLTKSQFLKRYSYEDLLNELIEANVIYLIDDEIHIDFLDAQYVAAAENKKVLSDGGKKGYQKKLEKQAMLQATLKPTLSLPQATLKHLDEGEEEDKRKKEQKLSIKNSILAAQQNLEAAAMKHCTSLEHILKFFNDFWQTNDYDTNDNNQTESEIRIHFNRWLNKNKPPQIKLADEWGKYEEDYYCAFFSEKTEPEKYKEAIEAGFVKYSDTELRFKIIKKQAQ